MGFYIGLMSGTSMDGVDAVILDTNTNQCLDGLTRPYSLDVKRFLEEILSSERNTIAAFSQLNTLLGREFAASVQLLLEKSAYSNKDIIAIGSHGQTICHDAAAEIPYTVQLGCPHTIAQLTEIPVVADFRTRDLIVGGQGAPFAPLYHQILFGNSSNTVVNIGGIANVSFLGGSSLGFDTGPGNCLMDAWTMKHLKQPFDINGEWAASGQIIESLLEALLSDPFFELPPPKSIGKEYYSLEWLSSKLHESYRLEDVQATLCELTARSISSAIKKQSTTTQDVVLCGGGTHNQYLRKSLQGHMPDSRVVSSADFGVNPDFIEAMLFAWLAEKNIRNIPLDLKTLTGANQPVILGAFYPYCRRAL